MSHHVALGEYSNAVANYESAAAALLASLRELQAKAAALPVEAHDERQREALATLTHAAGLKLSTNYLAVVSRVKEL